MEEIKALALLQAAWRYLRIILRQAKAMLRLSEDVEKIAERQKAMADDVDRKLHNMSDELEQSRKLNQIKVASMEARIAALERTTERQDKPATRQPGGASAIKQPSRALATIIDSSGRPLKRRRKDSEPKVRSNGPGFGM